MVASKISTQAKLDYDEVVRGAAKGIGYDRYDDNRVQVMMVLNPLLRASRAMSGAALLRGFAPTIVFDYCCGDKCHCLGHMHSVCVFSIAVPIGSKCEGRLDHCQCNLQVSQQCCPHAKECDVQSLQFSLFALQSSSSVTMLQRSRACRSNGESVLVGPAGIQIVDRTMQV